MSRFGRYRRSRVEAARPTNLCDFVTFLHQGYNRNLTVCCGYAKHLGQWTDAQTLQPESNGAALGQKIILL